MTPYILLSAILFCIGLVGVMVRRNTMIMLMSIELMLNASTIVLVAASNFYQDFNAQVSVFFIMIIAAAEVSVGLAIISHLFRAFKTTDIQHWSDLKE
jgi:NADH-quinone oxidoreductase subunit K